MKDLAPIVLFIYNRPWHTRQTLEALEKNEFADQSILYIYADGAKLNASDEQLEKIHEAREIARSKDWCKEVHLIERDKNLGLAVNIVDGVTNVVNQFGKIIVLEDDIVTSPGFLKFMNDALELYENDEEVMHISGYMFPVNAKLPETFFYNTASCWGWGTWQRAWKHLEWDASKSLSLIENKKLISKFNINNSYNFLGDLKANVNLEKKTWAVRWYASFFLRGGYALHPYPSLTNNIGHDGGGENCHKSDKFAWKGTVLGLHKKVSRIPIVESVVAVKAMENFYKPELSKLQIMRSRVKKLALNFFNISEYLSR